MLKMEKTIKENYNEFVEGFALTAEEVDQSKNKKFEIVSIPEYQVYEYQGKVKRYLKTIILFNEAEIEYRPNKDSQRQIISQKGRRLSDWQGFKGSFKILEQKIGNDIKKVIYIQ